MKYIVTAASLLGLAGCMTSAANAPATKPCVAQLSPPARKIFDAVQAGPTTGTLRERISTQTRNLVMEGELTRSHARPAAEEAADCLKAP
ncbi:MAG: hypothetical protein B7Z80_04725 [Rhodospirillales bacterium 20-64-7]|nr:MAG: hypothetical protein B7Z80_04725 [Rhodospirillales bacterium 20-64-7]HQT76978.1 hypothetical protein [Rhodopila sp.]